MRTYYIFDINKYYAYMYKNNSYKMYKILESIYDSRNYNINKLYVLFDGISIKYNKSTLNDYISYEFKYKYGYKYDGNKHYLNTCEKANLKINTFNIKITSNKNYTSFFNILNNYSNNLFVCDFDNMDYFWLNSILSLQKEASIVK